MIKGLLASELEKRKKKTEVELNELEQKYKLKENELFETLKKEQDKINELIKKNEQIEKLQKTEVQKAIEWASSLLNSEGAVIKEYDSKYEFGEKSSWFKYRHLSELIVKVLKKIPKERGFYNYLVGIPVPEKDMKLLDFKYISNGILVLGHTFNTKEIFEVGDKIEIAIEEVWRHEKKNELHYSIHKPRVIGESDKGFSSIDKLEDLVVSIGVSIIHGEDGIIFSKELAESDVRKGEGKEIEVRNFPERMIDNFNKTEGKWNPFIAQWHLRGENSIHTDMRFDIGPYLEGITLFTPGNLTNPDLLDKNAKNIRGTVKVPQPKEWLKVEGRFERGAPGTTSKYPAYFAIVAKGEYQIIKADDHVIQFEIKTDSGKVKKMNYPKEEEYVEKFNQKLPDSLKKLDGNYSYHIAHIGDRHIILFDKLKE